jgi:hypothetical protein
MPRPRTPQALRVLNGTSKDHPGRQNKDQPTPEKGIGPCNKSLNEYEREIWDEIVGISYAGVLGEADRIALEMMCRLIAEMRLNFDDMPAAKLTQLSGLIGRFGMTPADRTKIIVTKQAPKNPFAAL